MHCDTQTHRHSCTLWLTDGHQQQHSVVRGPLLPVELNQKLCSALQADRQTPGSEAGCSCCSKSRARYLHHHLFRSRGCRGDSVAVADVAADDKVQLCCPLYSFFTQLCQLLWINAPFSLSRKTTTVHSFTGKVCKWTNSSSTRFCPQLLPNDALASLNAAAAAAPSQQDTRHC